MCRVVTSAVSSPLTSTCRRPYIEPDWLSGLAVDSRVKRGLRNVAKHGSGVTRVWMNGEVLEHTLTSSETPSSAYYYRIPGSRGHASCSALCAG